MLKATCITAAIVGATSLISVGSASAQGYGYNYGTGSNSNSHYVRPHTTRDGNYVGGHYRTNPDSSRSNNYGASGNYNYHNGRTGNGYGGYR